MEGVHSRAMAQVARRSGGAPGRQAPRLADLKNEAYNIWVAPWKARSHALAHAARGSVVGGSVDP